jgi:hypothetical protein
MRDTTSGPPAEIDDESSTEPKDRWFDQWIVATGAPQRPPFMSSKQAREKESADGRIGNAFGNAWRLWFAI